MTDTPTRAALLRTRADHYDFCAGLLQPEGPSAESLDALRALAASPGRAAFGPEVERCLAGFAAAETDQDLRRDYGDLFVVPGADRIVLTENFVRSAPQGKRQTRPVQGPYTVEVARFYERAGYTFDHRGLADHLSTELQFLARLCRRAAADGAPRQTLDAERAFVLEHMAAWVDVLLEASDRAKTRGLRGALRSLAATLADHGRDFGGGALASP